MIRKSIFKKQNAAPAGYIPGLARGDTGFTTGIDTAPTESKESRRLKNLVEIQKKRIANPNSKDKADFLIDDTDFDKWNGYRANIFKTEEYTEEDKEADLLYENIDQVLAEKTKKRVKTETFKPSELLDAQTQKNYSITNIRDQFELDKNKLQTLSDNDWLNIPEPAPRKKNLNKNVKYTPVGDSILLPSISGPNSLNSIGPNTNGFTSNLNAEIVKGGKSSLLITTNRLAEGKDYNQNLLNSQSKIVGGKESTVLNNPGMSHLDRVGYLTQLNNPNTEDFAIQDIQKARLLFKSVRESHPKNEKGWLASARLEEINGRLEEAKKILQQGLLIDDKSEDLWCEFIRLTDPKNKEKFLLKALSTLPQSVALWSLKINLDSSDHKKRESLSKAIQQSPLEEAFWKQLVELTSDENEKREILSKSVIQCSSSVDLWLASAKYNDYHKARQILNNANRVFQNEEPRIWIAAAALEEANGSDESRIEKIILRGIKQAQSLNSQFEGLDFFLKQALSCNNTMSPLTAKLLLVNAINTYLFSDENSIENNYQNLEEEIFQYFDFFKANKSSDLAIETLILFESFITKHELSFMNEKLIDSIISYGKEVLQGQEFLKLIKKLINNCKMTEKTFNNILNSVFYLSEKNKISANSCNEFYSNMIQNVTEKLPNELNLDILVEDYIRFMVENSIEIESIFSELEKYWHLKSIYILKQEYMARLDSNNIEMVTSELENFLKNVDLDQFISFKATKLLGDIYLNRKMIDSFETLWKSHISKFNNMDAMIELAKGIYQYKNVFEARSIYTKVLENISSTANQWIQILEMERQALVVFKNLLLKAIKKFPENEIFVFISLEVDNSNFKTRVLEAMKKFPKNTELPLYVSKMFYVEGKIEKAKLWASKACEGDMWNMDSLAFLYCIEETNTEIKIAESKSETHYQFNINHILKPRGHYWNMIKSRNYLQGPLYSEKEYFFNALLIFLQDRFLKK